MLDSLTKRYSKAEETKSRVLATFLDPRYKTKAFTAAATTLETIKVWLQEDEAATVTEDAPAQEGESSSTEEPPAKSNPGPSPMLEGLYAQLLGGQASESTDEPQSNLQKQIDWYRREPIIDRSANPLLWWQQNAGRFDRLAQLARTHLGPPQFPVS